MINATALAGAMLGVIGSHQAALRSRSLGDEALQGTAIGSVSALSRARGGAGGVKIGETTQPPSQKRSSLRNDSTASEGLEEIRKRVKAEYEDFDVAESAAWQLYVKTGVRYDVWAIDYGRRYILQRRGSRPEHSSQAHPGPYNPNHSIFIRIMAKVGAFLDLLDGSKKNA